MSPNSCDICGEKHLLFLFDGIDRAYPIQGVFRVVKCKSCGSIFLNPQPSEEELSLHYPQMFYDSMNCGMSRDKTKETLKDRIKSKTLFYYYNYPSKANNQGKLLEKLFLFPLKFYLSNIIPWQGEGKVLDIGCGMGGQLSGLKKLGWDTYGVEPNEYAAGYAKNAGHKVIKGTLLGAKFQDNFFDAVMLKHVLEHLHNPIETLIEIKRILKTNGSLYILTPISDNILFKIFKEKWHPLELPRHLWVPSTKGLRILCTKTGMRINKIKYVRTDGLLGSIQYVFNERGKRRFYLTDEQGSKIYRNYLLMKLVSPIQFILEKFHLSDAVELEIVKI